MFPLLLSNDLLYCRKVSFKKCHVNDLIIIEKGRNVFTHRVIYKAGKYLITKGDNNLVSDGKIYPHQILGKVYQVKRNGKVFHPENIYLLQSSNYFQEIVKIKKAFEKEKIDFVFLKSLPLHLYFKKSHPRRIYADCDVLIDKLKKEKVKNILKEMEYKKINSSLSPIHTLLRQKQIEQSYYKKINGFTVVFDVHYEIDWMSAQIGKLNELYPQYLIDKLTVDCLRNKKIVTINNREFSILNTEFLILYLALHFFHHNFRGTYRLDLLDKVIRMNLNNELLKQVQEDILKYKLQNFVYPVFLLLKKYYSTPLSRKFLDSIKPDERKMRYIQKNILRINIFDDETRIQAGVTRFRNLFFLSLNPIWRKILIIFNIQVLYSFIWVIIFSVNKLLRKYFKHE